MKKLFLFIFTVLITITLLITWNSCTEGKLSNITNPKADMRFKKEYGNSKGFVTKEQMLDTFIVVKSSDPPDKSLDCKTMIIEGWVIHHFEEKSGKNVGIWPTNGNWYRQPSRLNELSGTFGFSYIFHHVDNNMIHFDQAIANGFPSSNIMVNIKQPANWQDRIDEYGNVLAYYWDEPYTTNANLSTMASVYSYIHMNTSSKLVIGDYKPSSCFDIYVSLSDEVFTSAYSNWYETILCIFFKGSSDQRQLWNSMRNRYSSKNLSNWVNSYKDLGEFSNLAGKASNLGLSTLWLYQLDDINNSYFTQRNHIMQFCNSAWYNGFLRRFSQYTKYYYRCLDEDCATCESENGNWELYKTITLDMREDFPQ